ncbi:hypothetical protein PF002_g19615 [Phytophthora fragariae]|uniref:Uncharacterized protein n=2 Tax=Phytophthora fragariae TaxID=53985 RepID=A0A6A3XSX9_9STRA|nr:hypothetical protein PF002_g19615 [Phytophthora fragariae]
MSDTHADMLKKLQTFLEQEEKPSTPGGTTTAARLALTEFWREMCQLLAVNDASVGLRALDNMADALINERGRAAAMLKTPVLILQLPSRMASTVGALPHSDFEDVIIPAGPAAVPQKRASSGTPAKGSKSKKPRSSTGSAKSSKSDSGSFTETVSSTLDFKLSPNAPAVVRQAIETIYAKAETAKRTPYQLAYPWEDIPLWYEPEGFPGIHLQNDKYDGPLVPEYDPKESKIKGYTSFMRQDATPTAAGPATEVDDDDPMYCQTPDEEVAEAIADAEAKDAAKSAALEAAFAEDDEEEGEEEEDATQKSADEDKEHVRAARRASDRTRHQAAMKSM